MIDSAVQNRSKSVVQELISLPLEVKLTQADASTCAVCDSCSGAAFLELPAMPVTRQSADMGLECQFYVA